MPSAKDARGQKDYRPEQFQNPIDGNSDEAERQ